MRAAVFLRNIVGVAKHRLLVGVVPLHRHFHTDRAFLGAKVKNLLVDLRLRAIQMFDEGLQATFVLKHITLLFAFVDQLDANTGVEERKFAQTFGKNVVIERNVGEDRGAWLEADTGARSVGRADFGKRRDGFAKAILLFVQLSTTVDGQMQHIRKRVHDRYANAVQAA